MKRLTKPTSISFLLALTLLLTVSTSLAQSEDAGYDLSWWTVDGGGGTTSSRDYAVAGTVGQPDAGVLNGGDYVLGGGFWGGGTTSCAIYLPVALKSK